MRGLFILFLLACALGVHPEPLRSIQDSPKNEFEAVHVSTSQETLLGKSVVKIVKDSAVKEVDELTFAKMKSSAFGNGSIEVTVLSKLLPNAPAFSRGFIGIAFRINTSNSEFECIYIRPANGRDSSQLRRNHTVQYFSFQGYKFDKLRKNAPGEYESYADVGLNEWIKLKLVVKVGRQNFSSTAANSLH